MHEPPMHEPQIVAGIHVIHPSGVYFPDSLRELLRLARAHYAGKFGKTGSRSETGRAYFILGAWVLEWLEAGEVRKRK